MSGKRVVAATLDLMLAVSTELFLSFHYESLTNCAFGNILYPDHIYGALKLMQF
jgi:hypothetical protein